MAESEKNTGKRAAAKKTTSRSRSSTHEKTEVVLADLRKGTRDSDSVRLLQKKLRVEVTGAYDGATQAAVRAWQNKNGFVGGRGLRLNEEQASKLLPRSVTFSDDSK